MILVILAAGNSTRYGSLKQLDPIIDEYTLMDYSIYDALKQGFNKIILVVREETIEIFKNKYKNYYFNNLIEFVIQNNDIQQFPKERTKPLGTGYALYVTKEHINEDFVVISADDYYGPNAFKLASDFLKQNNEQSAILCYDLESVLSSTETVNRGLCYKNNQNELTEFKETLKIIKENKKIVTKQNGISEEIKGNPSASMLFFILRYSAMDFICKSVEKFLQNEIKLDNEIYLPTILNELNIISKNKMKIIETNDTWLGMTYKEDKIKVTKQLETLIEKNVYPKKLF